MVVVNFISGGTGFVGRRLTVALQQKQVDVRLLSRGKKNKNKNTIECDLQTESIPNDALIGVDTIFHLAGFSHDMRDPGNIKDLYYKVNVDATIKLAKLAVRSGVMKFIFVSTVKAGGSLNSGVCASEKDQGEPEGVYGKTKREAELRLLEIGKNSSMQVSIIRPSLVYGPNVKGNLKSMLSGIKSGWFPPLPETNNKRSMIHVDDLVQAILLVSNDDRANGEIFIVTDGRAYSSRDIYNTMRSSTGKSILKWHVPKFLFDTVSLISPRIKYRVDKLLGNECYSSKKLELFGFKAQKTLKDINETNF
jgi:UDP-glucose 4-epimerase